MNTSGKHLANSTSESEASDGKVVPLPQSRGRGRSKGNKSYRPTINRLRRTKDWRDLGALKAELLDLTIMERNKHAKAVVQDIETQRREGLGVITIRPGAGAQRREAVR